MYAAISAASDGADVLLVDKSLVGRGGATIMAQMTVAAVVGEDDADRWTDHLEDTLAAGRGICNPELAAILCRDAQERIRELDSWKVGWARGEDGRFSCVTAPGHSARRCVYVDFLNTGPAIARAMRNRLARTKGVARTSGLAIRDLVVDAGRVVGAVGVNVNDGTLVTIAANSVVLAAGGLTKLFQRNSASTNMGGDAYALALRAGAELIDMEFPQFFPIGHLAPRLVGMDPIMWDPFRYKLGGRLLNGNMEEFIENYGASDGGVYSAPRDITSFAIVKENEAGRGSPAGGAFLSFTHVPDAELRRAFGPVIDLLAANGIDLTRMPVEVAPIAHYHMGGIRVNGRMEATVPGLYAAGEAVGGANGANRLSGNAITEALVFGHRAGRFAAEAAKEWSHGWSDEAAQSVIDLIESIYERAERAATGDKAATGAVWRELQDLMWTKAGLLRTQESLEIALVRIRELVRDQPGLALTPGRTYNTTVEDWFDLRCALEVAEAITLAALNRTESRGAHQRLDFPDTDSAYQMNQVLWLDGGSIASRWESLPIRDDALLTPNEAA